MPPYDESAWEHEYIEAGGLRFHMVTAGEGPVVLMLHGFPENWFAWRYQIDAVAKAGFKAVAVDMRGYGQTERPRKVSDY
ncbi:alpha/beta fold hydrolase, partial [bacterium]|nr:alpha/beta fold hydrolase [bacterium]